MISSNQTFGIIYPQNDTLPHTARKTRSPTAKKRDQKGEDGAGEARHTLRLCAYTSGGSEGVAVRVDEVDS